MINGVASSHIVIIAGEESGDMHAASLVKQLKAKHPDLQISGVGGKHMQNAGVELISDLARYGVTGITEVFRHIAVIGKTFALVKKHLKDTKPQVLVLVDYPGFNLRLAKFARSIQGLRIVYYVSPQIWAWKSGRIHTLRACVDKMAVILPFEKKIYEDAKVPVQFVGHPLSETIKPSSDKNELRKQLGLPVNRRIIAMLPGSRTHEIERHMPVMRNAAVALSKDFDDLHFVIPVASTIKKETIANWFHGLNVSVSLIDGMAMEVMDCSDVVTVASGTASLECALLEKPMCILYKASRFTWMLGSRVVKVKYLGLCNLLAGSMIVPELLQDDCNDHSLIECLSVLLKDEKQRMAMIDRLVSLKSRLSFDMADCTISDLVENEIYS